MFEREENPRNVTEADIVVGMATWLDRRVHCFQKATEPKSSLRVVW